MEFYVGNLAQGVTENDLKKLFGEYGEVSNVNIIKDRFSGQSKGYGFLEIPNNSEADKAIKELNRTGLQGRNLKIIQVEASKKRRQKRRF
jgi:RNA recognition motif-containing protein